MKVLIVDDNEQNLYLLRALLEGSGCTVADARHGAEALTKARQSPPELVVSDLLMPVMDGYTLLRHWKADDRLKAIPFVVYTATYTEPSDERLALDLGADAFILKPTEPETFMARIHEVLAKTKIGELPPSRAYKGKEEALLKEYSEVLIRKLEQKTLLLTEANRLLQQEIVERKLAEKTMIQLAAIVESSDDAIIGEDLDGTIQSWNAGAEKIFGYAAGEMLGGPMTPLLPAERLEEEYFILERIKSGKRLEHYETVRLVKGGQPIDVSVTVSPIKDPTGKIVGASKVARDITGRKLAEEQIRVLNAELEQRVAERTAQLQETNRELEAFSYSVSHDLRAPLRHILGFLQLLQQEAGPALPEKGFQHLTTISQAAKRMGDLIDHLLAFSRVAHVELQKTDVNLDELVRETIGDFQADTENRGIVWKIHPLPAVHADRALLRQALVNLMSNAVKFTGIRAQPEIEIGCAPGANEETVIFIRDNGAGFDPRYAQKLFGVFQRLHSDNEFEGTGIGLANVQRIIGKHGGRIWAEGAVNGGATFYFSIPNQKGDSHEH